MRKLFSVAAVAGMLGSASYAGEARAVPTVELIWQDSGTSSHSVAPGESAVLDVILHNDGTLTTSTFMVGIVQTGSTAPKVTAATNTPTPFAGVAFAITPPSPDGTEVGAFGGLSTTAVNPDTFMLGTITIAAGSATGAFAINPFQRDIIDEWFADEDFNVLVQPILSGATLNVIPEPATVSLFGLGFAILAARRPRVR